MQILADEQLVKESLGATSLRQGFFDRRVILITLVCFFLSCSNFGTVFWLPQIIKALGNLSNLAVGLLSAVPYLIGAIGMILCGRHSDRVGDRKWHLVTGALVGAFGYGAAGWAPTPELKFVAICIAALGIWSMFGVFWAAAGDLLGGMAAAGGLAFINSFGTLGGFVGPFLIGFIRERTDSFSQSLLLLAGFSVITGALAALVQNTNKRRARSALKQL